MKQLSLATYRQQKVLASIFSLKKKMIAYINAAPHYHEDDSYFKNKLKNPHVGILHAYLKYSECKVLKKSQREPLKLKEEY